jgi:hypothetical protein
VYAADEFLKIEDSSFVDYFIHAVKNNPPGGVDYYFMSPGRPFLLINREGEFVAAFMYRQFGKPFSFLKLYSCEKQGNQFRFYDEGKEDAARSIVVKDLDGRLAPYLRPNE